MTLKGIIKKAKEAALRDGYDQVIIEDRDDGSLSFCRSYPGCCPDWHGKIVAVVFLKHHAGGTMTAHVVV